MGQPDHTIAEAIYERYPGAASAPLAPAYRPRQPEKAPLYRILQANLETFLAEPLSQGGAPYPRYVEREFRRILSCGIPARGFYRLRCPECGHERLLGLSCSGRICPSCWGRRMADGAAHLVDRVLPSGDYRQYVLSFPYPLRIHLARDPAFLTRMLQGFLQSVFAWQRHRARKAGLAEAQTGAITFVQKFGSALNSNVHLHSISPSGIFVPGDDGRLTYAPLPPPTDDDVARLTRRIARRLTKTARRYLTLCDDDLLDPDDERTTLQHALATALEPPVRPQPALTLGVPEQPPPKKPLCAAVGGFSLHAGRTVEAHDREGLERLLRYGLRAPFSQQRLALLSDGRVRYELPRPWPTPTGVTELVMEPLHFLKRLASLIPAPYQNLVRYHGCFANRSRWRSRLPLPPEATLDAANPPADPCECGGATKDRQPQPAAQTSLELDPAHGEPLDDDQVGQTHPTPAFADVAPKVRPRRLPWAALLRRSLGVNGDQCPKCHSQMVLLALITARTTVSKILDHLHLPSTPPPIAPARDPHDQLDLLQEEVELHQPPADLHHTPHDGRRTACSRAPP